MHRRGSGHPHPRPFASFLTVIAGTLLATGAHAEPRYAPVKGALFRVEIHSVFKLGDKVVVDSRDVLDRTVVLSDGNTADTSNAMTSSASPQTIKLSAAGLAEYLASQSSGNTTTYRHFLVTGTSGLKFGGNAAKPDGSFVGTEAGQHVTTSIQCGDWKEFERFFPIGRIPVVILDCTRSADAGHGPERTTIRMTVTYEGDRVARTAAGEFPVKRIRIVTDAADESALEQVVLFSDHLGIAVVSDSVSISAPRTSVRGNTHLELTRVQ